MPINTSTKRAKYNIFVEIIIIYIKSGQASVLSVVRLKMHLTRKMQYIKLTDYLYLKIRQMNLIGINAFRSIQQD